MRTKIPPVKKSPPLSRRGGEVCKLFKLVKSIHLMGGMSVLFSRCQEPPPPPPGGGAVRIKTPLGGIPC